MADDHRYYLRQRTQPPIPSGLSTDIAVTTVTTSSSHLPLPPQLSLPRQQPEQSEQTNPVPTVASLPGGDEGFGSVTLGIDLASKPTDQTAVFPVSKQSDFANVGLGPQGPQLPFCCIRQFRPGSK